MLKKLEFKSILKLISVGIIAVFLLGLLFNMYYSSRSGAIAESRARTIANCSEDEVIANYTGDEAIAESRARRAFFCRWRHLPYANMSYRVSISEARDINISILKGYKVYRAAGYIDRVVPPVDFCLIAVKEGRAFLLPDELNKIILREKIKVEDENDAFKIAETYVKTSEGFGTVKILRNASDMIPPEVLEKIREGKDEWVEQAREKIKEIEKFSEVIKPPKIERIDGEYFVYLYTYTQLGGCLDRWLLVIDRNGVKEVKKEEIASGVGFYYVLA